MEAIKLDELAKECQVPRQQIDELRRKLGIKCKKRDNVWTITADEAEILRRELDLPAELQSPTYYATGLHPAANKNWVFCTIDGYEGKHPVLIPPRYWGKLIKKRFPVERIEDANGVTWRHEWFRNLNSYDR